MNRRLTIVKPKSSSILGRGLWHVVNKNGKTLCGYTYKDRIWDTPLVNMSLIPYPACVRCMGSLWKAEAKEYRKSKE